MQVLISTGTIQYQLLHGAVHEEDSCCGGSNLTLELTVLY